LAKTLEVTFQLKVAYNMNIVTVLIYYCVNITYIFH